MPVYSEHKNWTQVVAIFFLMNFNMRHPEFSCKHQKKDLKQKGVPYPNISVKLNILGVMKS